MTPKLTPYRGPFLPSAAVWSGISALTAPSSGLLTRIRYAVPPPDHSLIGVLAPRPPHHVVPPIASQRGPCAVPPSAGTSTHEGADHGRHPIGVAEPGGVTR